MKLSRAWQITRILTKKELHWLLDALCGMSAACLQVTTNQERNSLFTETGDDVSRLTPFRRTPIPLSLTCIAVNTMMSTSRNFLKILKTYPSLPLLSPKVTCAKQKCVKKHLKDLRMAAK